jgi:endonuclease G
MQLQTFYFTNSVPQVQVRFNDGIWNSLEQAVQNIVRDEKIYVTTGVAFEKVGENKSVSYIKSNSDTKSVPIPNYFYKVVLKVKTNSLGAVTSASTIGFWMENKEHSDTYTNYSVSADQIEAWTGFDFFVNLPDAVENPAEQNSSWDSFRSW